MYKILNFNFNIAQTLMDPPQSYFSSAYEYAQNIVQSLFDYTIEILRQMFCITFDDKFVQNAIILFILSLQIVRYCDVFTEAVDIKVGIALKSVTCIATFATCFSYSKFLLTSRDLEAIRRRSNSASCSAAIQGIIRAYACMATYRKARYNRARKTWCFTKVTEEEFNEARNKVVFIYVPCGSEFFFPIAALTNPYLLQSIFHPGSFFLSLSLTISHTFAMYVCAKMYEQNLSSLKTVLGIALA